MAIIPAGATLVDRLLEDISTRDAENGKNTGAELFWLRTRLDDRRRERQRTTTVSSVTSTKRQRHGTLLEKIMTTSEAACERDSKNTTQGLRISQVEQNFPPQRDLVSSPSPCSIFNVGASVQLFYSTSP